MRTGLAEDRPDSDIIRCKNPTMTKLLFMVLASWLLQYGASEYVLVDDYMAGGSFLDQFDFFSVSVMSHGHA